MQIETIRIFCDVVELQNLSRTAERHGISQSAVSQQLAQLELAHKCQLIDRKKRPLAVTAAGEIFYRACKDILDRYDHLKSELAQLGETTARIKVAAIFSIGMHTLQPYVKRFMSKYPKINLQLEYSSAGQIYERVLAGQIDVGLVAVPKRDRNIDVHPFEDEPLVLVTNRDHPLATATAIDIHRLQGENFIAFAKNVPSRTLIDGILSQYNVSVRTVTEFDNTETIKRAVEIGAGVSILPEVTLRSELAGGTLAAIPFSNDRFTRPTAVIVRKNKTLTHPGRFFIELLGKGQDTAT